MSQSFLTPYLPRHFSTNQHQQSSPVLNTTFIDQVDHFTAKQTQRQHGGMSPPLIRNDTSALREELRPLMEKLKAPHNWRHLRNNDEFAVLAAIAMGEPIFKTRQLANWVIQNFRAYFDFAVPAHSRRPGGEYCTHGEHLASIEKSISRALSRYEVPIFV